MLTTTCDGCRRRIADDDPRAARRLPLGGELVDWCGECVGIVRTELPRLAAEAREARTFGDRVREGVRQRARNLWSGVPVPPEAQRIAWPADPPRAGQMLRPAVDHSRKIIST